MADEKKVLKKICMLGDFAVGKTSLIRRFVLDEFDDRYIATVGTKITKKEMHIDDNLLVLQIWDIIGNIMYTRLQKQYYKGSDGAFVVCDVTREDTCKSVESWVGRFREISPKAEIIFLANKIDLEHAYDIDAEFERVVDKYKGHSFKTSAILRSSEI